MSKPKSGALSEDDKRRCVAAVISSCWVQGPLEDAVVYDTLQAIMVEGRLPSPDLVRWYELVEPSVSVSVGGGAEGEGEGEGEGPS